MIINRKYLSFTIVFMIIICVESYKILFVMSSPALSHHISIHPFINRLGEAGHELVVLAPYSLSQKNTKSTKLVEISLRNVTVAYWAQKFNDSTQWMRYTACQRRVMILKLFSEIFEKQFESFEVQNFIKSGSEFDLTFILAWTRSSLIFSHIFNTPLVQVSPLGEIYNNFAVTGASTHPKYFKPSFCERVYNLSLWETVTEVYKEMCVLNWFFNFEAHENRLLKRIYGSELPNLNDMFDKIHLSVFNTNPIWDGNRPMPLNTIFIGGPSSPDENELPQDLRLFLDSSKQGVIYVSFGSTISMSQLPEIMIKKLQNVLSELPYDVLWKWELDNMPGFKPGKGNVKISKWFPQAAILRHTKVKLFITQGGLHSTNEAINGGVPLIGVPILGDQKYNTERLS